MPRNLLIVLVIVTVLLVALPLGMGMAMGMCPASQASICPSAVGTCAALVGLVVLALLGVLGRITDRRSLVPVLLLARPLERPPRGFSL